jgi:hypothetical protein
MSKTKDAQKSYDEKELEILRKAVDVVEARKGTETMRDPEIKKIISIVEKFIADKRLVCYGGTAINNILPEDAQFYNKDIELPDYDFYSDKALDHAKELADIYYKAGYEDVEAKAGVHYGTYKVFVNFTGIADITHMEPDLFKAISKDAIIKSDIRYAPPNFLRMAMYLELSRPDGDVSRWEKVQKRLVLLNTHYPLKGYDCDKIQHQRGFEGANSDNTGEMSIHSASRSRSRSRSRSASASRSAKSHSKHVGGGLLFSNDASLKKKAIHQITRKYKNLSAYMHYLFHKSSKHEEELGKYTYTIKEDKVTHRYNLVVKYSSLLQNNEFTIHSLSVKDIERYGDIDKSSRSRSKTRTPSSSRSRSRSSSSSRSRSRSRSSSSSRSRSRSSSPIVSVDVNKLKYHSNKEIALQQSDIYTIVRRIFIKNKTIFFGGYANILYSRYMPKHQRRIVQKIPDFDILSEDPHSICEEVVRELIAHHHKNVKYVKHKGVGEVISEHYDIRIGDEVVAFVYKPLACHSYNTIRIENDTIRIATIDTMLSFYLAFIYADRIYYDQNRILCMSQFLFDVQQHNRLNQTGLLRRFSINCYGTQDTLDTMRFEKTKKYEELKNKKDSKEYEGWFLRYVPMEVAKNRKGTKKDKKDTTVKKGKDAKGGARITRRKKIKY